MKNKKKKLTNKDFENRDNILMMELENLKAVVNDGLMMFTKYIKFKNDVDKFTEHLKKEAEDVRPELQKPSS